MNAPEPVQLQAVSVAASKMTKKRARWLWQTEHWLPQIPLGELVIGAGREGVAKTQFTYWLAAHITHGTLPGELHGQPRAVIICAREDDWEKTIGPRLEAAGADLGQVYRVQVQNAASGKSFELVLPWDNDLLQQEIVRLSVALVIFDPLLSALSPRLNAHKASDVRLGLEPLVEIAHATDCSMIGLAHFAKMEGRDSASLISGSHAFKDLARAVLVFARDGDASGLMSQPKNNLGRMPAQSLEYSVESVSVKVDEKGQHGEDIWTEAPKFVMGNATLRSVEDLLDTGRARAVSEAKDFLRDRLSQGKQLSKDILDEAHQLGIAARTMDRARKELGITPRKDSDGKWWMEIPDSHDVQGGYGSHGGIGSLPSSNGSSSSTARTPTTPTTPLRTGATPPEPDWPALYRMGRAD